MRKLQMTTKEKIVWLLTKFPEARQSYNSLFAYWLKYVENIKLNKKDFEKIKNMIKHFPVLSCHAYHTLQALLMPAHLQNYGGQLDRLRPGTKNNQHLKHSTSLHLFTRAQSHAGLNRFSLLLNASAL